MTDIMKDVREAFADQEAFDGSVEVEPLLRALEAEQIDSLSVLNLCFPTEEDVASFARKNSLNMDQCDWLMRVRGFTTLIAQSLIEEVVSKMMNANGKRTIEE